METLNLFKCRCVCFCVERHGNSAYLHQIFDIRFWREKINKLPANLKHIFIKHFYCLFDSFIFATFLFLFAWKNLSHTLSELPLFGILAFLRTTFSTFVKRSTQHFLRQHTDESRQKGKKMQIKCVRVTTKVYFDNNEIRYTERITICDYRRYSLHMFFAASIWSAHTFRIIRRRWLPKQAHSWHSKWFQQLPNNSNIDKAQNGLIIKPIHTRTYLWYREVRVQSVFSKVH